MSYPTDILYENVIFFFWVLSVSSYLIQLFSLLEYNNGPGPLYRISAKSKLELVLRIIPYMVVLYAAYRISIFLHTFFKDAKKLPKTPLTEIDTKTFSAMETIMGVPFENLPLYVNHKNPVVRKFVLEKLK